MFYNNLVTSSAINFLVSRNCEFLQFGEKGGDKQQYSGRERERERKYQMTYDCSVVVFIVTAYFTNEIKGYF